MTHDVSGRWTFFEEFDFGTDRGFAEFQQEGNTLRGILEYEECIDDEEPFMIRQYYEGTIEGDRINLHGVRTTGLNNEPFENYNLDTLEGTYTSEGKIVGHSFDCQNICGVFVMTRKPPQPPILDVSSTN